MQIMIDAGKRFRTQLISEWLDMGNGEAVLVTNRYLLAHGSDNSGEQHGQNAIIIPPVNIHPTARLENSVVGPHVTIAANCKVTSSVIRDSVLDDHATVKNAMLDKSLVGKNAKVEGHAQTVNIGDSSNVSL
jgi:glucose-1-phosphate thymidylyltransferase